MGAFKTEEYAVAFVDFLGTTDIILKDVGDHFLNSYKFLITTTLHSCSILLHEKGVSVKMFSDNIILCKKVDSEIKDKDVARGKAFISVAAATSFLQYAALDKLGMLARGGITIGELYIDYRMVWGKALIDAHNIEKDLANYPRVVVKPALIDTAIGKLLSAQKWIVKDEDGLYYLDYIWSKWESLSDEERKQSYAKLFNGNQQQMNIAKENYRIIGKQIWHGNYLNRKILQYSSSDVQKVDNEGAPTLTPIDPS